MSHTEFVSNGVGNPVTVRQGPMKWENVSTGVLRGFLENGEPEGLGYSRKQIEDARCEFVKRKIGGKLK